MNENRKTISEVLFIKEKFKDNLGMSLAVGLITAIWFFLADIIGVHPWAGFLGWSIFFFAGADVEAAKKTLPPIIIGPLLAYLTVYGQAVFGSSVMMVAFIAFLLGFIITILQVFTLFEVAGATFVSANVYFASMSLYHSIVGVALGLILGLVSVKLSALFDELILGKDDK